MRVMPCDDFMTLSVNTLHLRGGLTLVHAPDTHFVVRSDKPMFGWINLLSRPRLVALSRPAVHLFFGPCFRGFGSSTHLLSPIDWLFVSLPFFLAYIHILLYYLRILPVV